MRKNGRIRLQWKALGTLVLMVLLVLTTIELRQLSAADTEDGGFELSLNWNMNDDSVSADKLTYHYDTSINETKVIRLNVRYANRDMQGVTYAPGEVVITVPGIGKGYRSNTPLQAKSVAADKASAGTSNYVWNYTYSASTDTYTFTNNDAFVSTEHLSGSFELLWEVPSRSTIHGYTQELQAKLRASGNVNVDSEKVQYTQGREKDEFTLELSRNQIYTAEGYDSGINADDYYWVKYQAVSGLIQKSWGLKSSYFEILVVDGAQLRYADSAYIQTGSWTDTNTGETYTVYRVETSSVAAADLEFVVAYPRGQFGEAQSSKDIPLGVKRYGTWQEETNAELLREIFIDTSVWEYEFDDYDGEIVGGKKNVTGIGAYSSFAMEKGGSDTYRNGYIDSRHMRTDTGGEYTYYLEGYVNYPLMFYDFYDIILTDEELLAREVNGGIGEERRLEQDEYHFSSVTIPARREVTNLNNVPVKGDVYPVDIYIKQKGDTEYKYYSTEDIEEKAHKVTFSQKDIYGIRLIVNNVSESIDITFPATVVFHTDAADIETDGGAVVNKLRIGLLGYDDDNTDSVMPLGAELEEGEEDETEPQTEEEETEESEEQNPEETEEESQEPQKPEAQRENHETDTVYAPSGILRTAGDVHEYEAGHTKDDPYDFFADEEHLTEGVTILILERPNFYYNVTSLSSLEEGKDGYNATLSAGTYFDYMEDETLQSFSMYTILPEGMELNGSIRGVDDVYEMLTVSGTGLSETQLKRALTVEMDLDYKGEGRTWLAFHFNLGSNALTEPKGMIQVFLPVYVSKEDFASRNSSYAVRSVSMIKDTHLVVQPSQGINTDAGSYAASEKTLWEDINGNGDITERLSYSSMARMPAVSATESLVSTAKYVKTASTGSKYVQPGKDGESYKEDEIPFAEMGASYSYRLRTRIAVDELRSVERIVIMDALETGPASKWQGTFERIDVSAAEKVLSTYNGKEVKAIVWYSAEEYDTYLESAGTNGVPDFSKMGWTENPEELSEVRTVAVDFGDARFSGDQYLSVEIYMTAPAYDSSDPEVYEITENKYALFYEEENTALGQKDAYWLPSELVPVSLAPTLGTATVLKKDNEDEGSISGAVFSLYKKDGELVKSGLKTNSQGRVIIRDLELGEYYLMETERPLGYVEDKDTKYPFELTETDQEVEVTIYNERKDGQVKIRKTSDRNSYLEIPGAVFDLYDDQGHQIAIGLTTGSDGTVTYQPLEWGRYYVVETMTPAGYEEADPEKKHYFTIDADDDAGGELIVEIENEQKPASVHLIKYEKDEDGNPTGAIMPGAVYELYLDNGTQNGKKIGTYMTDDDGEILVEDLAFGDYYFQETIAPDGYLLPEDAVEFTLDANHVSTACEITAYNQRKTGEALIMKVDDSEDENVIQGAEFGLYTEDGTLLQSGHTDEKGILEFLGMHWGKYYVQEITAPSGYELSDEKYPIEVTAKSVNKTFFIDAVNVRSKGSVKLIKVGADDPDTGLEGAEFIMYRLDGTIYRDKDSVTGEKLVTDSDGELLIEDIEWGNYYFEEVKAPVGYGLTDEKIRVSINPGTADYVQELVVENPRDGRELKVTKRIAVEDINYAHGVPTFLFKVENAGGRTWYKNMVFDETYVLANEENGYVDMSVNFTGLVSEGSDYTFTVSEENVVRYETEKDGIQINSGDGTIDWEKEKIVFDLTDENKEYHATFRNEKLVQEGTSSTVQVQNLVKKGRVLTGLTVEYLDGDEIYGDPIDPRDLEVIGVYDDGSVEVIDATDCTITPDNFDAYQNYDDEVLITVSYMGKSVSFYLNLYTIEFDYENFKWCVDEENKTAKITINCNLFNEKVIRFPNKVRGYYRYDNGTWASGDLIDNEEIYTVTSISGQHSSGSDCCIFGDVMGYAGKIFNFEFGGGEIIPATEKIILPTTIEEIGPSTFASCINLREISMKNVKIIGERAFYNCGLEDLVLPHDLEFIGQSAFSNNTSMKSIQFPAALKQIDSNAFGNCSAVEETVTVPASIEELSETAFGTTSSASQLGINTATTPILQLPRNGYLDETKGYGAPQGRWEYYDVE